MLNQVSSVNSQSESNQGHTLAHNSRLPLVSEWLESPHLRRIVSHLCLRHGFDPDQSEDILQETCISLIRKGMDSGVNATLVFKVVASRILDCRRKSNRAGRNDLPLTDRIASSDKTDPELAPLLRSSAAVLPKRLKAFFNLRYRLGMNQIEIARQLGISRSAVRHIEGQCLRRLANAATQTAFGSSPCRDGGK
jgi:RNA polymerase sigma factor (sigma-70 family)